MLLHSFDHASGFVFLGSAAVINGREKLNGWLNLKLQSPHDIESRSNIIA